MNTYQRERNRVKKEEKKLIVIGGGPAGIAASLMAKIKNPSLKVTLLEENSALGKKLLATGNGRCNLSNRCDDLIHYHGDRALIESVFRKVSFRESLTFLSSLGLLTKADGEGRIYPYSESAATVCHLFYHHLKEQGVQVIHDFSVASLEPSQDGFVVTSKGGEALFGHGVIVATGGRAGNLPGAHGNFLTILKDLKIDTRDFTPVLVAMKSRFRYQRDLKGIRAKATVSLMDEKGQAILHQEKGEVQFTEYGLSGIAVMACSRYYTKGAFISLDLMDSYSKEEVFALLEQHKDLPMMGLEGILSLKLCSVLMKDSHDTREILAQKLKNWIFPIEDLLPHQNAQVARGGVLSSALIPGTLQSKDYKGLYFAGEVVDVDGTTGGYNIQWALSSGLLAGKEAAE